MMPVASPAYLDWISVGSLRTVLLTTALVLMPFRQNSFLLVDMVANISVWMMLLNLVPS